MKSIDESYVVQKYAEGESTISIAKELGTYAKKIERILVKNGIERRSRSEGQKLALKSGRSKHPTEGKVRSDQEKEKISVGREAAWSEMSPKARLEFRENCKERWANRSPELIEHMHREAGVALRKTLTEGSKCERFLKQKLEEEGYEVAMHKKGLIEGNFEIDLLLPEINTIIEVDGPQHFLPVFGEENLANTIKQDSIKNGRLLAKGFCIIRIRYLIDTLNRTAKRKIWSEIFPMVSEIKDNFPPKDKRLIELEVLDGRRRGQTGSV